MKLASFTTPGGWAGFGAVVEGGVVDLGSRLTPAQGDLQALIAGGGLDDARHAADTCNATY